MMKLIIKPLSPLPGTVQMFFTGSGWSSREIEAKLYRKDSQAEGEAQELGDGAKAENPSVKDNSCPNCFDNGYVGWGNSNLCDCPIGRDIASRQSVKI